MSTNQFSKGKSHGLSQLLVSVASRFSPWPVSSSLCEDSGGRIVKRCQEWLPQAGAAASAHHGLLTWAEMAAILTHSIGPGLHPGEPQGRTPSPQPANIESISFPFPALVWLLWVSYRLETVALPDYTVIQFLSFGNKILKLDFLSLFNDNLL